MNEFYEAIKKLPIIRKQISLYTDEISEAASSEANKETLILDKVNKIIVEMNTQGLILDNEDDITLIKTTLHVLFLKQKSYLELQESRKKP